MMDRRDVQAFLKGVSTVVREQLSSMAASLSRLEARIETVAAVQPLKGEPGESVKGDAGASAFELARSAGFSGTLEEWLASLKGKDAPAIDVDSIVLRAAELVPKPSVPPVDEAGIVARVLLQVPKVEPPVPVDVDAIVIRAAELTPKPEYPNLIEWFDLNKNGFRERVLNAIGPPSQPEPVDEEAIILHVLERIPTPEPGKSVDPEEVRQMVAAETQRAVAALPPPPAGKDADMGTLAHWVTEAVSRAAETLTTDLTQKLIAEIKAEVAKIPPPKDGVSPEPIHPDTIALQIREAVDKLPKPEPARPGEPGKSALEIEVRTGIDPEKSYPAGTVATYQGGTIRAFRNTDAVTDGLQNAGWQVLLDGVADEQFIQGEDFRSLTFTRTYTSGRVVTVEMKTPFMQHIGYWDKSKEYFRSECVTQNGSTWYCMVDSTTEKPGEGSTHWLLIARKGSDGKDYREPAPKNGSVHFK